MRLSNPEVRYKYDNRSQNSLRAIYTVYTASYYGSQRRTTNFLEQLAKRIPRLFDAIKAGNIKSEYIVGVRRIGQRHVRLKLVAEVVDSGANPLRTHSTIVPVRVSVHTEVVAAPETASDMVTSPVKIASNPDGDTSDEAG